MNYIGLCEEETESSRYATEIAITPETIGVVGPMGSGTRLMCRVLDAGGFHAIHDSLHGRYKRPFERVVLTTRDHKACLRSMSTHIHPDDRICPIVSELYVNDWYHDSFLIKYEELIITPDLILQDLARWLGVEPWPFDEPIK